MKLHLLLGFAIGATINLVFQCTDTPAHLDLLELGSCAIVAALAGFTAALLQCPNTPLRCRPDAKIIITTTKLPS
jgi:hypothetical protein